MVVQPLGLTGDALKLEPQPLGDGTAAAVLDGTINDHPIEPQPLEDVVRYHTACLTNQAAPLMRRIEPIAQFHFAVGVIDWVQTDGAGERAADEDAALERAV